MVPDPTTGTFPRHVKLEMFGITALGDTVGGQCSGTLISPMHVLTAGHCVYYHVENGLPAYEFADQVTVTPGFVDGEGPWESASAASMISWSGWVDNEDRNHDVALITLDRPLGAFVGWRSYGYNTAPNFWYDPQWSITGYPAEDPFDGQSQWTTQGTFDVYYGHQIQFDEPSWGGASGSSSLKNGVAYGVLTASDRETKSIITRLTADKFGDIQNQIAADQPNTPDLWPLQVITSASNATIDAGATLGSFFFRLHNFSAAAWSGPIPYQIMLSTNPAIAGSDIEIHSGVLNLTIPANGTEGVNIPAVQINPDVPAGGYYVGVRLNVNDADPFNDDSQIPDLDFLTVNCPSPPAPWMGLPADDTTCVPTNGVQLAWGNVASAASYQLIWGPAGGPSTVVDGLRGTEYTLPQLSPGENYFWSIRASNACGVFGVDSPTFAFITRDDPISPMVVFPEDGDMCQPAFQVVVDWEDVPAATGYQIRVMSSCGFPVTPISTTLSAYPILGLNDDQTYFYQVRTKGACGNYGAWSDCRSFTTRPSVLGVPQQFTPAEGYSCVGTPTGVSWETILGAEGYEVAWGNSCVATDTVTVAANTAQIPVTGEGTWYWKVRARRCDTVGDWSACHSFVVDASAPELARNFVSISHVPGEWSQAAPVTLKWDDAADAGGCGIVFYDLDWTDGPVPPLLPWVMSTPTHPHTTAALPDGMNNFVHLWARDAAGNYASASQTIGPFLIDTRGPDGPVVTSTPNSGEYTNHAAISATWSVPADSGIGLAGYRHALLSSPHEPLPAVALTHETLAEYVGQPEGAYWMRLAAFDSLGNASDTLTVGPLGIDHTPPAVELQRPEEGTTLVHLQQVSVLFTATDNLSGVAWLEFEYSPDDIAWFSIATGTPVQLISGFIWQVPYPTTGTMRLRLRATDHAGNEVYAEQSREMTVTTAVGVGELAVPRRVAIAGVHPNPFNPRVNIRYGLPESGPVQVTVHDATGRLVRTLVSGQEEAGWREQAWNGLDDGGRRVASGLYFARVLAGGESAVQRMTLIK